MMARSLSAALAVLAVLAAPAARAGQSDRECDTLASADRSTLDELQQVSILSGHVVLTRCSMRMEGERMEQRQDAQGYQHYTVTAADGGLASFHERRDPPRPGVESTIDGVAERIEYDEHTDIIRLSRHAVVKLFENGVKRDELGGEVILYDARRSTYEVDGRKESRIVVIIAPSPRPGSEAKKPPGVLLTPDRGPSPGPRP